MNIRHRYTFVGLSTTHQALAAALAARGHEVTSFEELRDTDASAVRESDLVIAGADASIAGGTPGHCVFYDVDESHAPIPKCLLPCVDPAQFFPILEPSHFDLAYFGCYGADRQPALERLLFEPARARPHLRFAVVGAQYPRSLRWPSNVEHVAQLAPSHHRRFYAEQRWALSLGHPSPRFFEAAACGTPIITDRWKGIEDILTPGREVLVADTTEDVLRILEHVREEERRRIADAARRRILAEHTAMHRAKLLEQYTDTMKDEVV